VRKSGFGEQSFIAEMRQMMWRTREMAILPIGADSGTSSFLAGTSTIRLKISYLVVITLRGEESRCHGTKVPTWSGRVVPNACC
jgi:hypothetical protein